MVLYGTGPLERKISQEIERLQLGTSMRLAGVLDFTTELVPLTRRQSDLFVCCHRQGDPSCTYLEMMSCGVPIVGYGNDAFRGLVGKSHCGWVVPIDRPDKVAEVIARLNADRTELIEATRQALEFGRKNTFERTFRARIDHLRSCAALSVTPLT